MEQRQNNYYFRILFIITIFLTLVPFFKVGLTNGDDAEYYMLYMQDKHAFNAQHEENPPPLNENTFRKYTDNAQAYAKSAGRFYFLITKPLYSLPYIFDNFFLTKCIQYFFLILSFAIFSLLLFQIFKSKWLALITFLFLIIPLSIMPFNYYVPINYYPFFFSFSFSLAMLSLLLLLKYYEKGKYKFVIFSVILYAIAILFYETYLLFLGGIILFILIRNIKKKGFIPIFRSKEFYKEITPYITVAILYISVYFIYRVTIQTDNGFYHGSSFAEQFSLYNFFQIIFGFNNAILPTKIYHLSQDVIAENSLLPWGHHDSFRYILLHSSATWIANAVIQVMLFIFMITHLKPSMNWRTWSIALLLSLLFMIGAHTLIGISDKYNTIYHYFDGYVTSYYSMFAVALLLVLLFYAAYKLSYRYRYLRIAFFVISSCLIFYTSIITSYTNDHLGRDWERSQNRFMMVGELSKQGAFDIIPEEAIVYAGNLDESSAIYGKNVTWQGFYWNHFIYAKGGPELKIYKTLDDLEAVMNEDSDRPLYLIQKKENRLNNNMFMIFSEIDKSTLRWDAEDPFCEAICIGEAQLHYYSPMKSYHLTYAKREFTDSISCNPSYNSLFVNGNKQKKILSTTVDFNKVYAKSVVISNYNTSTLSDTVSIE